STATSLLGLDSLPHRQTKAQERIGSVLYLAEVQKRARVIGNNKVEFKLLACQRSEHSWSAVSEELIGAPDDVQYNSGALVLVELSASRQVQRYNEAGRQLVSILQNFSRLQDKFKTQEEEIEQWKQSLTYQSQELNRREMEIETRQDQLQQMEEDFEQLEQQRREIDAAREEVDRLQEEFERKSQELEGAWSHLHGEIRRFEEQKEEFQGSAGLSAEQVEVMQSIVERLSGAVVPTEDIHQQINQAFEFVTEQQSSLDQLWQSLEPTERSAQESQDAIAEQEQELQNSWNGWHESQSAWVEVHANLQAKRSELTVKQESLNILSQRLQQQTEIKQNVIQLAEVSGIASVGDKVNVAALEALPLEQLQTTVKNLRQEWEKNSRFVSSQEEELTLQQQEIEKIKQKIGQASEYERLSLENELSDEQESYRMLHETLVGQRRNVSERELVLRKHESVLAKREGLPISDGQANEIDLEPVLNQIETMEGQISEEIRLLEQQVQELQSQVSEIEGSANNQAGEQSSTFDNLKQREQELQAQRSATAEQWGKVNTSRELLQQIQDGVNTFREKVEAIANTTAQLQEGSDHQLQSIHEMQQVVQELASNQSPQLAAS
ncbi:MAG: pilus motility taxis protein HmpF, partial [Elainellaceae cyanobacterium]